MVGGNVARMVANQVVARPFGPLGNGGCGMEFGLLHDEVRTTRR